MPSQYLCSSYCCFLIHRALKHPILQIGFHCYPLPQCDLDKFIHCVFTTLTQSTELKTGVVGACYIDRLLAQIIIVVGTNYIMGAYFVYNWESIVLSFSY